VWEVLCEGPLVLGDVSLVVLVLLDLGDDAHVKALEACHWSSLATRVVVLDEDPA